MWQDLAKFPHFGDIFHVFGNYLSVYLVLGTIFNLLEQILYATGQIFLITNGQKWYKNLIIWSHCLAWSTGETTSFRWRQTGINGVKIDAFCVADAAVKLWQ